MSSTVRNRAAARTPASALGRRVSPSGPPAASFWVRRSVVVVPSSSRKGAPPPGTRYDARARPPQWQAWLFGVVFGLGVTLLVVTLFQRFGPKDVSASVRAYEVVDDTRVRVTVAITRDPERDSACYLRARGRNGSEVGHVTVLVRATSSGRRTLTRDVDVPTTARAVTALTGRCLALEPGADLPFDEPHPLVVDAS